MFDLKSIGSPRARNIHQLIITGTVVNMWQEVHSRKKWNIMYEATVTDNPYDNYPDIIIHNAQKQLVFSLEITRNWGFHYDRKKCIQLKQRFPEAEFFIYNYESDVLYALADDGNWYNSNDYQLTSRLFQRPILDYIYIPEDY